MDQPEVFIPINPCYLLQTISGGVVELEAMDPNSRYLPTIIDVLTVSKQENEEDASVYIEGYKEAVLASNFSKAIAAVEVLFVQRDALTRALVEATVLYVGQADIRYTDLILGLVFGNISAINTVLYTKLLVNYPNKLREIRDAIRHAEREVADANQRKANKGANPATKEARSVIVKDAKLVVSIHNGEISTDYFLKSPPPPPAGTKAVDEFATVRSNVAGYHYEILDQVDPDCTVLLFQLSKFKDKHFTDARKTPLDMPKSTTADRKIADRIDPPRR